MDSEPYELYEDGEEDENDESMEEGNFFCWKFLTI